MPGLTDEQKKALAKWYAQDEILDRALSFLEDDDWLGVEEYMHKDALVPLGKVDIIPDYLKDQEGKPLLPFGINPAADLEAWQDAIEVGWAVMSDKRGIDQDRVNKEIAKRQQSDWDNFLRRVEERKKAKDKE